MAERAEPARDLARGEPRAFGEQDAHGDQQPFLEDVLRGLYALRPNEIEATIDGLPNRLRPALFKLHSQTVSGRQPASCKALALRRSRPCNRLDAAYRTRACSPKMRLHERARLRVLARMYGPMTSHGGGVLVGTQDALFKLVPCHAPAFLIGALWEGRRGDGWYGGVSRANNAPFRTHAPQQSVICLPQYTTDRT